jgi:hypothetical protein
MGKPALRAWADQLEVPAAVRGVLAEPYDFGLVLLGNEYLEACRLGDDIRLGGPTLLICGANMAKTLPRLPRLRLLALSNAEAKRFSCALIGLKGELAARILRRLADGPALAKRLFDPARSPLDLLADDAPAKAVRGKARPNPKVDQVITLPESWHNKPHRARLRYFIPEWDDLVDPDYDFATDTHAGGSGDWSNEVYAHQMYPEPNYDGLLVSKVVAEKSRKKKERINALGVHRFLRVPREFPVMGDCGAFGYIAEDEPPYSTDEILDYYTRLDFDYGVSIDHLIVTSTEAQKQHRYQLTIHNAETFLREHQARGLPWTPIGAVRADFVQDKVIRLAFSDGTGGYYDLAPLIGRGTEMVKFLEDETFFRRFFLELGALCWPNGFELSGGGIQRRLREQGRLRSIDRVACTRKTLMKRQRFDRLTSLFGPISVQRLA